MINLLPPEEKQKLLSEKKQKLAIVLGIVVLFGLVCLALILMSIKFYLLIDSDYQKNILEQTRKENQVPDFANLNIIIQKYNGVLAQLDSFYKKEIYLSQVLDAIKNVPSPEGLYMTNFALSRDENGKVKVIISGVSASREDLLLFKKNIGEDPGAIENLSFSPESWISPNNVNFSFTFEVSKPIQ